MYNFTRPDIIDLIGPEFDCAPKNRARKTLIICSAPRTGSYELCRFLTSAGVGIPHEYFNPNYAQRLATRWGLAENVLAPASIESYINMLYCRRIAGDVFACKIQHNQFIAWLQNDAGAALLDGAVVVHLFRPDISTQVASYQAAMDSGLWDYSARQTTAPRPPASENPMTRTLADIDAIVGEDAGFRRLFARFNVHPHFITTEDLFAQPRAVVEGIASALGASIDSDALNSAIAASKPYLRRTDRPNQTIAADFGERAHPNKSSPPITRSEPFAQSSQPERIRGFWHGSQLGPYQLLGLRSFADRGHRIELFTYDSTIAVPGWIVRRDANEIFPTDHVLAYQNDLGRGSFALHSNLFRYAMLHKLGGWGLDLDIVLLRPDLPKADIYFAVGSLDPIQATFAAIKFPAGHPALAEAVERCLALGETAPLYGETGPDLFTEMVAKHDLAQFGQPMETTYPISALDVPSLFDPDKFDELEDRCANSQFVHLFNETWRRAGIPSYLGPPAGSFIDNLLRKHGLEVPFPRMKFSDVKRWTAYLTLHDEFQAGLRAYRQSNEALRHRLQELESGGAIRTYQATADSHSRRRESWREKLKPKLGRFKQYEPRELRTDPRYLSESLPDNPPCIAIVTPSFNQAQFLIATANSVLNQKYPNLVYIIQDGGSIDGTQQLFKSHNLKATFRSEPDSGQANAINRGFAGVDADIMAYLNSDDLLAPGTLAYVARYFAKNPDIDVVYGHRIIIDAQNMEIGRWIIPRHDNEIVKWVDYIPQETLFWRRRVWERLERFEESFQFALDWDFILRAQEAGFRFKRLPRFLGCFRIHDQQKTATLDHIAQQETKLLRERYLGDHRLRQVVHRAIRGYLREHVLLHRLYKLKILRY
jgi:LPS sulfotransferase NodH